MKRFIRDILVAARERTAVRKQVRVPCQLALESEVEPLATECLDISADGMRVLAARALPLDSEVRVTLTLPATETRVRFAASVRRVVRGRRRGDQNMELGLRFLDCSVVDGAILDASLSGHPPPVPARRLRMDYAASVLRIAREGQPGPLAWA